jgi:hypothetical protein
MFDWRSETNPVGYLSAQQRRDAVQTSKICEIHKLIRSSKTHTIKHDYAQLHGEKQPKKKIGLNS